MLLFVVNHIWIKQIDGNWYLLTPTCNVMLAVPLNVNPNNLVGNVELLSGLIQKGVVTKDW